MVSILLQFQAMAGQEIATISRSQLERLTPFLSALERRHSINRLDQLGLIKCYTSVNDETLQFQVLEDSRQSVSTYSNDLSAGVHHKSQLSDPAPTKQTQYSALAAKLQTPNSRQVPSIETSAEQYNQSKTTQSIPSAGRFQPIDAHWQPSQDTLVRLEQHGIPVSFAWSQLDEFHLSGTEQGKNRNDWNTRFFRHVKTKWVYAQNDSQRHQRITERTAFNPTIESSSTINHEWRPNLDAQEILLRAGIQEQFIADAIPEFVLYWSERGEAHKTWNSKFVHHVRQQWARYSSAMEHSTQPTRISNDWQASNDCYDILAMGHIPEDFARQLIPEFVLYWRDSNQVHNSWNSRFIQYAKQQWAKRLNGHPSQGLNNGQQTNSPSSYATAEASINRLSDTSWAD